MKKHLTFLLSLMMVGGLIIGNATNSLAAEVVGGTYVKGDNENNPVVTQNYGADPGVLVYNDEVFIYATNDSQELAGNNENTYAKIDTLNCYSSKDLVNWTDHGSFKIAGSSGAAKWAKNSWAPCIACKKINGKDKFFLYFANNGSGIGVLTADSPTGPWKDPIGKALITGSTPGCSGVTWMFDPAVLVDSDGTGYLYFGGGIPNNQYAHPKTARVIKLGADMTSVSGSASTIDAPYLFEDSGINKIGNTYYYSYCSNWNCSGGFNNAAIEYMTSSSPMGPYTYQGEVMKNPGVFFNGSTGNNHHQIFEFGGQYYLAYHTRSVESKVIGKSLGYRTTQIDKLNVSNGKISSLTPTMSGVSQTSYVDPYSAVQAETIFTQCGIGVSGNGEGAAWVDNISNGDYTKVKGVNFSKGLSSITVSVNSRGNGTIQVRENSPSGNLLGTINLSNTNNKNTEFTGTMKNVSGVKNICFVFNGSFEFDYWKAAGTGETAGGNEGGNLGGNQGTEETGNQGGNETAQTNNNKVECENMTKSGQYTGTISSPFSGVALYGNNDTVSFDQYFAYDTHNFTLRGCSNNSNMAKVVLKIGGETKGTFYYGDEYPAEYTIENVTHATGATTVELTITSDDGTWDAYLDYLTWDTGSGQSQGGNQGGSQGGNQGGNQGQALNPSDLTLLNTYGQTFGYSGTCINLYQLRDANTLELIKKNYNSITLENEMKPDALLGGSARLISVADAKNLGYYIPDNYRESYVPQINFSTVDEVMKICYQNGLRMRAHTLVWHSQTPSWFFRSNFSGNAGFVNQSTMDARLEMYVKTVMNHVYLSEYGSVVYAWDIANEVMHAQNSGWEAVYGNNRTNASYVKKAFTYAYQTLDYFNLTDSVSLFYNDYNTYQEVDKIITLVNYINSDQKMCSGVGMQSHLGTNYPSVDFYISALKSFLNAGFEVQITEMDITNNGDNDLSNYVYNLYKNINSLKKNGGKITSITWWGLSDQVTWINNAKPLLFSTPTSKKPAYDKVIQAYTETFGTPTSGYTPEPLPTPHPSDDPQNDDPQNDDPQNEEPAQEEPQVEEPQGDTHDNAYIEDGWYYVKNYLSQKYLTVEGNSADGWVNVCISNGTGVDGQKWYVTNTNDGYINLTSALGSVMLDVANGENEDGTNVGIYQGYGGNAQKFVVKQTDNDGYYTIATKSSDETKVLDVYKKKTDDGTNVCQWSYNGGTNQLWQFEKVGGNGQSQQGSTEEEQPNEDPQTVEPQPTPAQPDPEPVEEPTQEEPTQEDPAPAPVADGLDLQYSINSWGSGYQVSFKVTNNSSSDVNSWTLKLNKNDINIGNAWNVNIDEDGDYYVITPVGWNAYLSSGQSTEFGILGDGQIGDSIRYSIQN
ncbi:endo-1,4-beta-xylanase [Butyrivibrio sp. WCD2001]|uniref:endo-1,4-beta-xylanase n=1 Tax=Butyrivibrio sp. WCD2001 TaxID=1280681 RepID=UPI0003FF2F9D|nr:endo-1,4-beta-xylanase [Butyrivibrio sp. WCD2001]